MPQRFVVCMIDNNIFLVSRISRVRSPHLSSPWHWNRFFFFYCNNIQFNTINLCYIFLDRCTFFGPYTSLVLGPNFRSEEIEARKFTKNAVRLVAISEVENGQLDVIRGYGMYKLTLEGERGLMVYVRYRSAVKSGIL